MQDVAESIILLDSWMFCVFFIVLFVSVWYTYNLLESGLLGGSWDFLLSVWLAWRRGRAHAGTYRYVHIGIKCPWCSKRQSGMLLAELGFRVDRGTSFRL